MSAKMDRKAQRETDSANVEKKQGRREKKPIPGREAAAA